MDSGVTCRVAIGSDGQAAVMAPGGGDLFLVMAYSVQGVRTGQYAQQAAQATDVGVNSDAKAIYFTWLYNSNTGREPMVRRRQRSDLCLGVLACARARVRVCACMYVYVCVVWG
jgi:hypothetical protein